MHLVACSTSPLEQEVDYLVMGIHAEEGLSEAALEIDQEIGGIMRRLWEHGDFSGKTMESLTLALPASIQARFVMLVGLGNFEERSDDRIMKAAALASHE